MTTMQAIIIDEANKSLHWQETATPTLKAGEVLIESHASAVNRADLVQRSGKYPPPAGASTILGLEVAGVVVEVADDVDSQWIGKRVCALLTGGGYAEFVAVDASMLLELPSTMSFEQAAAFPEVFTTAFVNLILEGQAKPGERLLLHAAGSGVGTAVIQLCKHLSVDVYATAGTSKIERLIDMGVKRAIDRHQESFARVIEDEVEGGVDVIIDPVGEHYFEDNINSLRLRGRLVLIGLLSGRTGTLNMGRLLVKRLHVVGSVLRSRPMDEKREIIERMKKEVWPLFCDGTYQAVIHTTLPIQDAEQAHTLLAGNTTFGKIILTFK